MLKPASRMTAPSTTNTKRATRDVEERDQRYPSCFERADAVLADREGDGAEHAERREPDDEADHLEQHVGDRAR